MPRYLADYDSVPLEISRGEGVYLFDKKGRRYLDFIAGWCVGTVGWKNPKMAEAISAQAREGVFVPAIFRYAPWEEYAKALVSRAPGKIRRAFRCTSGSEAVEFAIKCARASTGRSAIISIDGVYHGHTYGAASVGDACIPRMAPCLPSMLKLPLPRTREDADAFIGKLEAMIRQHKDVAAFLSEPFWTNAGCYIPPADFYPRVQEVCRRYGVLLVMDEVAAGFGRPGKFFASELWGIEPDIICLGKSIAGGYGTIAATLVTEDVFRGSRGIPDYSTFGWMPQDLAAARANLDLIERDGLVQNAAEVGAYLLNELKPLESLKKVREVRGIGLCFAIEFRLPIAPLVAIACGRKGVLVAFANRHSLFFSPPLCLDKKSAREGAEVIKRVCGMRS